MHISLTPELEAIIKEKVTSGLYNNASEVIREALRFMKTNEELINQMKLDHLRSKLAEGERDLVDGQYTELKPEQLSDHFQLIKNRAIDRINQKRKPCAENQINSSC